jgi:hypothetical protein
LLQSLNEEIVVRELSEVLAMAADRRGTLRSAVLGVPPNLPHHRGEVSADFLQYVEGLTIWASLVRQVEDLDHVSASGKWPWPSVAEQPAFRLFHDAAVARLDVLRERRKSREGGVLIGDSPKLSGLVRQRAIWSRLMGLSPQTDLIDALRQRQTDLTSDDALMGLDEEQLRGLQFEVFRAEVEAIRSAKLDKDATVYELTHSPRNARAVGLVHEFMQSTERLLAICGNAVVVPRSVKIYVDASTLRFLVPLGEGSDALYQRVFEAAANDAAQVAPLALVTPATSIRTAVGSEPVVR